MATFKDARGQEWLVNLDAPTILAVRNEFNGLDLADLTGKTWDQLEADIVLLVNVLWVVCRKQAQAKNISDETFGESLFGDPIDDAKKALMQANADFFPEAKRTLFLATVNENTALRELAIKKALAKIADPELKKQVVAALEKRMDAEVKNTLTQLSNATSSPESLE